MYNVNPRKFVVKHLTACTSYPKDTFCFTKRKPEYSKQKTQLSQEIVINNP